MVSSLRSGTSSPASAKRSNPEMQRTYDGERREEFVKQIVQDALAGRDWIKLHTAVMLFNDITPEQIRKAVADHLDSSAASSPALALSESDLAMAGNRPLRERILTMLAKASIDGQGRSLALSTMRRYAITSEEVSERMRLLKGSETSAASNGSSSSLMPNAVPMNLFVPRITSNKARTLIFEVIVRQAMVAPDWERMLAGTMQIQNITAEEVREELSRRLLEAETESKAPVAQISEAQQEPPAMIGARSAIWSVHQERPAVVAEPSAQPGAQLSAVDFPGSSAELMVPTETEFAPNNRMVTTAAAAGPQTEYKPFILSIAQPSGDGSITVTHADVLSNVSSAPESGSSFYQEMTPVVCALTNVATASVNLAATDCAVDASPQRDEGESTDKEARKQPTVQPRRTELASQLEERYRNKFKAEMMKIILKRAGRSSDWQVDCRRPMALAGITVAEVEIALEQTSRA